MAAAQLTCHEAEAVAFRTAVACAMLEGFAAGVPVALFVALVGLLESGVLAWSVGVICGAMVLGIVLRGRVPSRLASLARVDAGLGLRGALEVGVTLEHGAEGTRFEKAIAGALSGRLGRADVVRAGLALRPALLGAGLVAALILTAAIRVESVGVVDVREARLMAGRPTAGVASDRDSERAPEAAAGERQAVPEGAQDSAPALGKAGADKAEAQAGSAEDGLAGEGEAAGSGGDAEPLSGSNLENQGLGARETSKLAAGAPSGVTPGQEGGKISTSPGSSKSGAWWPARHDAVVRAWLDSFHTTTRR